MPALRYSELSDHLGYFQLTTNPGPAFGRQLWKLLGGC
jgi:hypothetical protein